MYYCFIENTTFLVAIIIFVICVIIGFFGDLYLRKQNKIGRLFEFKKKNKEEQPNKEEEPLVERNEPLITSENVNAAPVRNDSQVASAVNNPASAAPVGTTWGMAPGAGVQMNTGVTLTETTQNTAQQPVTNQFQEGFNVNQVPQGNNSGQDLFGGINPNQNTGGSFNSNVQNQPVNPSIQNQATNQFNNNQGNNWQPFSAPTSGVSQNMSQEIGSITAPTDTPPNNDSAVNEISDLLNSIPQSDVQDVNRPVPFDGNLQNDDNINNMF